MPHGSSVATKAAISLLDDTTLQDKTPKLCPENGAFYYLDKTSTETVDDDLILATNSGTGRWHKTGGAGGSGAAFVIEPNPPPGGIEYPPGTIFLDTDMEDIYFYLGFDGTQSSWFYISNIQLVTATVE